MKLKILNKEGKKVSEKETKLFEEPIREDIIVKVVEAEKIWQPWSYRFRAGMDRSASGNITHRRHVWKTDRGRGLSRIPRKIFSRRGTNFSWEGAIVPSTKGGRRAHGPKGHVNDKKINKKELKKTLLSALSYVSSIDKIKKKYESLRDKKVDIELPLIVDKEFLKLKSKSFFEVLKKILGELKDVAVQKKSVRAGKGKMRGRRYKKNAGLLLVVDSDEKFMVNGIDVVKVGELIVSDLASNGARLCIFSEKAVEELEGFLIGEKKASEKVGKVRKDKRKLKKDKRIKNKSTTPKSNDAKGNLMSEGSLESGSEKSSVDNNKNLGETQNA